jgi:hypothetical protein
MVAAASEIEFAACHPYSKHHPEQGYAGEY